jgi:ketosteroid isomerase-like protein
MAEDNVEILRSLYEVWGPHQVEAALRFFDPDCEMHSEVAGPGGSPLRGHEGVKTYWKWRAPDSNLAVSANEFIDLGDGRVLVPETAHFQRAGSEGNYMKVWPATLWTLRNGKVVRWEAFPTRTKAAEALGLPG